jgi:hypothetical protein
MNKSKISLYTGLSVAIMNFIYSIIIIINNGFWVGFSYLILCIYCFVLCLDLYDKNK